MNLKLWKSRRFNLVLPVLSALVFGGCASQSPDAQAIKERTALPVKAQSVKSQPMHLVVQKLKVRQVYKSAVFALQFSPDGRTLASAGGTAKTSPYPGEGKPGIFLLVQMLDAQTLRSARTLPLLPDSFLVAFPPDLKTFVINPRASDGLQLIDATTGKILWGEKSQPGRDSLAEPGASFGAPVMNQVSFSPGGKQIVACLGGRTLEATWVRFWSAQRLRLKEGPDIFLGEQMLSTTSAAFSPNGQRVVMGGADGALALCDTKTSKVIWWQRKLYEEFDYNRRIENLVFAPDGKTFASTHQDHSVRLWNAQNGQLLRTLKVHSKPVQSIVFSPDSAMLASGSQDGMIVVSSTRSGETLHLLPALKAVTALTFAPDGKHLAVGCADGKIALWRID